MRALSLAERSADAALVEGLAVGDDAATLAFVRRFQSAVFGLAVSITRDHAHAEDVSQEVFVRAWRAAANYDPRRASVRTWLLTITRNAAIDSVRARRPMPADDDTLDALLLDVARSGDGVDVEGTALRRLDRDRVVAQLRELPDDQSRAVVLAVIGGCTAAEVAEREGIPLGTAKTRIRTGLIKLRRIREEEHHD
ncbi:MAG TPA: sigma-70 family RNA polymerase sigma factor [Nocardioidaceae bacterium]|nr:sigma-70 family RNA polymerase sigma factor [Nocardioidaceae bacterium]